MNPRNVSSPDVTSSMRNTDHFSILDMENFIFQIYKKVTKVTGYLIITQVLKSNKRNKFSYSFVDLPFDSQLAYYLV